MQRGDFRGERLELGLLGRDLLGLLLDSSIVLEHLAFDLSIWLFISAIWFWIALYSSFFLTWLSLTLRSSILAVEPLDGVFFLLELDLRVLERLRVPRARPGDWSGQLAGGERLRARGQPVAEGLGSLVEQVKFAEIVGGGGHGLWAPQGSCRGIGSERRRPRVRMTQRRLGFGRGQQKNRRSPREATGGCVAGSAGTLKEALELPASDRDAEACGRPWPRSAGPARG